MQVLIIKTSSLGDIVQTFPAVTDACKKIPTIHFDWVCEENFSEVPTWHKAVSKVIKVAFRRLRKTPIKSFFSKEWKDFRFQIKEKKYDLIIDAQGLLKSAFIAKMALGPCVGLDMKSVREPLAAFAYQKKISVDPAKHAIWRMRSLFAKALGYDFIENELDYALDKNLFINKDNFTHEKYVVFIHGTTWETKKWPFKYWLTLAELLNKNGYKVKIPYSTDLEYSFAKELARGNKNIEIITKGTLTDLAFVMANAFSVISVDTGLGHLASALKIPAISLYGPTDPKRIGTRGENQMHLWPTNFACAPCSKKKCSKKHFNVFPPCFEEIKPELVFEKLKTFLDVTP